MKPSKRKRRIQAIKARLKEYYHLKEMNNYFKRNFIELTRHPADYSLFMDNKSIGTAPAWCWNRGIFPIPRPSRKRTFRPSFNP